MSSTIPLPVWAQGLIGAAVGAVALLALWRAYARRRDFFDLRGRVVFITGGSSGIGRAAAARCLAAGASVALMARKPALLEEARRELERGLAGSGGGAAAAAAGAAAATPASRRRHCRTASRTEKTYGGVPVVGPAKYSRESTSSTVVVFVPTGKHEGGLT